MKNRVQRTAELTPKTERENEQGLYTDGREEGSKYSGMDQKKAHENEQSRYTDDEEQGSVCSRIDPQNRTRK